MSEAAVPVKTGRILQRRGGRGVDTSPGLLSHGGCFQGGKASGMSQALQSDVPALCASMCIPGMCAGRDLLICSCLLLCPSALFWGGAKGERRGFLQLNRGQAGRTWALGQEEETSPPQPRFPGWGLGRMPSGEGGWTMPD